MNREAAFGRLFFYLAKVKKHGPALGWGHKDIGRTVQTTDARRWRGLINWVL